MGSKKWMGTNGLDAHRSWDPGISLEAPGQSPGVMGAEIFPTTYWKSDQRN